MLFYLIPVLAAVGAPSLRSRNLDLLLHIFFCVWFAIPILFEQRLGGDFISINLRASLVDVFDFGVFFESMVSLANSIGLNVSSFYSLVSLLLLATIGLREKSFQILANPFIFILLVTGYQRQGLAFIILLLAFISLLHRFRAVSVSLAAVASIVHPTAFFLILAFAWVRLMSKLHIVLFFSPLAILFFLPHLLGFNPVFDHMLKNYFLDESESAGALPRLFYVACLLILLRPYLTIYENRFALFVFLALIILFFLGASTVSDRYALALVLLFSYRAGFLPEFHRFLFGCVNLIVVFGWMFSSDQFWYNWKFL